MHAKIASFKDRSLIKRLSLFIIAGVISVSSVLSIFTNAFADNGYSTPKFTGIALGMSPQDQARSYAYYKYLRQCFSYDAYSSLAFGGFNNWISAEKSVNFDWFADKTTALTGMTAKVGVINDNKGSVVNISGEMDSTQDCYGSTGTKVLKAAAALWGYTGTTAGAKMLCDIGFKPEGNIATKNCYTGGSGWRYVTPDNVTDKLDSWYKNNIGFKSTDVNAIAPTGGKYMLYYLTFATYCGEKDPGSSIYPDVLTIVPPTAPSPISKAAVDYSYKTASHTKDSIANLYEGGAISCKNLAAELQKTDSPLITGIVNWIKNNKDDPGTTGTTCENATTAAADATCGSQFNQPTCGSVVTGIGWLLCPVLTAMGGLDDAMWNLISGLLQVSPLGQNDITEKVWGTFRSLANVVLVIIFLIMIFSQLTGQGISNYGIKKALPRLVVMAVLINTSYILIQIVVDVFNILGGGLYDLVNGVIDSNGGFTVPTWQSFIGMVATLTTGAAVGAGVVLAIGPEAVFFLILPALLAAIIGLLAALAVLILRQALIPILAILAPLALAAYLLPNTKPWFDKWRKALVAMLLVYPMAAILFTGAKLSAVIINGNGSEWWQTLVALIILGVPLFLLPFIARQTNPMLAKLGTQMAGGLKRATKPVNDWAGNRRKAATARADATPGGRLNFGKNIRQGFQDRARKRDIRTDAYKAERAGAFNEMIAAGGVGKVRGARANAFVQNKVSEAKAQEIKEAGTLLSNELARARAAAGPAFDSDSFLSSRATSTSHTTAERAAAMHALAAGGSDKVIRNLMRPTSGLSTEDRTALQGAIDANGSTLAGKAPDIVRGADRAFAGTTAKDMLGFSPDTAKTHMEHLEALHAAATSPTATQTDLDAFNKAMSSFNAAVSDIKANPSLQAEFKGAAGTAMRDVLVPALGSTPTAFQSYMSPIASAIQRDGKIR